MTGPAVSVVIPAYNNARTLSETIDSVLAQDGIDFEVIIGDHSSSDSTRQVMDAYAADPRVTLLTTEAGGGAGRNWNAVTDAARGTYLKLVCGDDLLLPGVLARQAALLQSGAILTACRRNVVDSSGNILMKDWGLRGVSRPMPGSQAVRAAVRAGSNPFGEPASVMMVRDALERSGGWFDAFPYLIDQASYSRVLLRGDFVPDLTTGAAFRMSDTQWSVALASSQSAQARGFHHWLRDSHPEVVSGLDVRMGDVRAALMSRARRLSYLLLERRMR